MTEKISANSKLTARDFNFFPPRSLRLTGALGKTTPLAKNNTFANSRNRAHNPSLQKSCFLALAPVHFCNI